MYVLQIEGKSMNAIQHDSIPSTHSFVPKSDCKELKNNSKIRNFLNDNHALVTCAMHFGKYNVIMILAKDVRIFKIPFRFRWHKVGRSKQLKFRKIWKKCQNFCLLNRFLRVH